MKTTKMNLGVIAFIFLFAAEAFAAPIVDDYVGANGHGYGDVIGDLNKFQISSAGITRVGNELHIDIITNFAGLGDDGLFEYYTDNPFQDDIQRTGIGYGDLFLAVSWDPYGDAPYETDDASNGTDWGFVFALDDHWSLNGGSGTLYELSSDSSILLSDNFMTGAIYRNGQEIAVDPTSVSDGLSGTWSISDNAISFWIDVSDTALADSSEIAIHWGPTCGNDIIEGSVSVPEPTTLVLFGVGLLAISYMRRRGAKSVLRG